MPTLLNITAAIVAAVALAAPGRAQVPLDPISTRLLAAHNRERALANVPPLAWDAALAASAASYGPSLAILRTLRHSPRAARPGQRENLWMGTAGAFSPEQMVANWASEKRYFRSGTFPNVSTTGNWLDVSHYTTMVWPTTTRLGCAIHRSGGIDYLICRYSPPGNIDGEALILPRHGERG